MTRQEIFPPTLYYAMKRQMEVDKEWYRRVIFVLCMVVAYLQVEKFFAQT